MTDGLRVLGNLNMRWADIVRADASDNRSPEEIKETIKDKLRKMSDGYI